jgi:hypothetical protein
METVATNSSKQPEEPPEKMECTMNDEIKTATEMSDDALDNVAGGSDE